MKKLSLPVPGKYWIQEQEKDRNRLLSEYIDTKLDKLDLEQRLQTPYIMLSGSNTAFSIPDSVTTLVPFDTQVGSNDPDSVNLSGSQVNAVFTMDLELNYNLYHTGSGVGTPDFTFSGFISGVLGFSSIHSGVDVSKTRNMAGSIVLLGVPKSGYVDLRVFQNNGSPVLFDLTKSRLFVKRLSYNPIFKRSRL